MQSRQECLASSAPEIGEGYGARMPGSTRICLENSDGPPRMELLAETNHVGYENLPVLSEAIITRPEISRREHAASILASMMRFSELKG